MGDNGYVRAVSRRKTGRNPGRYPWHVFRRVEKWHRLAWVITGCGIEIPVPTERVDELPPRAMVCRRCERLRK